MPATFHPYTIDGAQFDVSSTKPTKVVPGWVDGIQGDPATAYDQVITAVRNAGYDFGQVSEIGGFTVYLRQIAGKAVSDDTIAVEIVYDTDFGASPVAYIVSYSSFEQPYRSNRVPGSRIKLLIPKFVIPEDLGPAVTIPGDLAMQTFAFPMRQVQVSGIKQGAIPAPGTYDGWQGFANASTFLGLPRGYWKISSGGQDFHKFQGWYSYRLVAITKNLEDWSTIHTLFNAKTHKFVETPEADELFIRSAAYDYGIMATKPGLLRVGPCPVTEFNPLFGFSDGVSFSANLSPH